MPAFDHVHKMNHGLPTIFLYADLTHDKFESFHTFLIQLSQKNEVQYVLRYRTPVTYSSEPLVLSGYGVELAIKNTEYKVIDDQKLRGTLNRASCF